MEYPPQESLGLVLFFLSFRSSQWVLGVWESRVWKYSSDGPSEGILPAENKSENGRRSGSGVVYNEEDEDLMIEDGFGSQGCEDEYWVEVEAEAWEMALDRDVVIGS